MNAEQINSIHVFLELPGAGKPLVGYLSFDRERRLVVSRRLHEEFDNGKTYYEMEGRPLREPRGADPDAALAWHRDHVFVG